MSDRSLCLPENISFQFQSVGILLKALSPKLCAKGQTNAASRQFEQLGRVDIEIELGDFRNVDILRMHRRERNRRSIRGNGNAEIAKWIKRCGGADELVRIWIEDRIRRVQNPVVARRGDLLLGAVVLDLTIAEPCVITPVTIQQFVALHP